MPRWPLPAIAGPVCVLHLPCWSLLRGICSHDTDHSSRLPRGLVLPRRHRGTQHLALPSRHFQRLHCRLVIGGVHQLHCRLVLRPHWPFCPSRPLHLRLLLSRGLLFSFASALPYRCLLPHWQRLTLALPCRVLLHGHGSDTAQPMPALSRGQVLRASRGNRQLSRSGL